MSDEKKMDDLLSRVFWREASVREMLLTKCLKDFQRGWSQQLTEARKRRREILLEMAAELFEIRKTTMSATAWCEFAMEDVIVGDARMLRCWADGFLFKDEDEEYRNQLAAVFAKFRQISLDAADFLDASEKARQAGEDRLQ